MSFTTRAGAGLALLAALVAGCTNAAASHSAAPKPTRMPHSQHASPSTEAAADPAAHSPTPMAHHHRHHRHHHHHHAQPVPVVVTPPPPPPTMAPPVTVNPIPQGNGGDQDGDNNGGPSDGDGNV